jgi:hypothetical protein
MSVAATIFHFYLLVFAMEMVHESHTILHESIAVLRMPSRQQVAAMTRSLQGNLLFHSLTHLASDTWYR